MAEEPTWPPTCCLANSAASSEGSFERAHRQAADLQGVACSERPLDLRTTQSTQRCQGAQESQCLSWGSIWSSFGGAKKVQAGTGPRDSFPLVIQAFEIGDQGSNFDLAQGVSLLGQVGQACWGSPVCSGPLRMRQSKPPVEDQMKTRHVCVYSQKGPAEALGCYITLFMSFR